MTQHARDMLANVQEDVPCQSHNLTDSPSPGVPHAMPQLQLTATSYYASPYPVCTFSLTAGFVLASSNTVAGILADMTRAQGLGNTGCFAGGAIACVSAGVLLLLFSKFGDLGRDDLIAKRVPKVKPA